MTQQPKLRRLSPLWASCPRHLSCPPQIKNVFLSETWKYREQLVDLHIYYFHSFIYVRVFAVTIGRWHHKLALSLRILQIYCQLIQSRLSEYKTSANCTNHGLHTVPVVCTGFRQTIWLSQFGREVDLCNVKKQGARRYSWELNRYMKKNRHISHLKVLRPLV